MYGGWPYTYNSEDGDSNLLWNKADASHSVRRQNISIFWTSFE